MPNNKGFYFYPTDFLGDDKVQSMTTLEIGAHIRLLCIAWQQKPPGTLPNDDVLLAKWAHVSNITWAKIKTSVKRGWVLRKGRLYNDGLRQSEKQRKELADKRRIAGQKGGQAKGKQTPSKKQAIAKLPEPEPEPIPLPLKEQVQEPPTLPEIITKYQEEIKTLTPTNLDALKGLVKTYSGAWVVKAIDEASLYSGKSIPYIKTILARWKDEGGPSESGKGNLAIDARECSAKIGKDPCVVEIDKAYTDERCGECARAKKSNARRNTDLS